MPAMDSREKLSDDAREEWFLDHLSASADCFGEMLAAIEELHSRQQSQKAEACAELLQEELRKTGAEDQLLILLEARAARQSDPGCFASGCMEILSALFQQKSLMQLYLAACGLRDDGVHPREAVRRLRVLRALHPGRCCYEKTWGLGRVISIDEFDRKLMFDFEKKRSHSLAFHYAAEAVQPLDDDSLLALKLRDPDAFRRRVKSNPAETVKEMLGQFGEMSLARLRSLMTALVFADNEWNPFWAEARPKLSSDPLVQMPAGRTGPIRLLAEKKAFDDQWRKSFLAERDIVRILAEVEELFRHSSPQNLAGEMRLAVEDRLAFAVKGAGDDQHGERIQALLLADEAALGPEKMFELSCYGRPEFLQTALNSIPARMIRPFLAYLDRKNPAPVIETIVTMLDSLLAPVLNEVVLHCRQSGAEARLFAAMRSLAEARAAGLEMISWMGRNLDLVCEKKICQPADLARMAFDLLGGALAGGKRKEVSQARSLFTNENLLREMLVSMDEEERADFCRRLSGLPGLAAPDRNEIIARVVLLFPDLSGIFSAAPVSMPQPKVTSLRMYREKQAQLAKIVSEDIPHNSREIGVARSYGDLRENYEYKAAKEAQSILMRRQAELQKILSEVKSTDFAGSGHEAAGMGASVELKLPDGKRKIYHILGEWDSDEQLGIISCRSKMASVLNGRRAGDSVELPGEQSGPLCVIERILELPPEIKAWISGA